MSALVLAVIYAAYVAYQVPAVAVPVLALGGGLAAAVALDGARKEAWGACFAVILAVLHARVVPADARLVAVQLGLAAFVAASATLSLMTPPAVPRIARVLAYAIAIGLTIGAPAGIEGAIAGAIGGLLAGARPLATLAVVAGRPARDPWLAWSPITPARGGR